MGMGSIEEPLDLHPSSADPVGFVPMDLGDSDCTIPEPDHRRALELDPPAVTVLLDEHVKLPDLGPGRDRFSLLDPSNKFEVHGESRLYRTARRRKGKGRQFPRISRQGPDALTPRTGDADRRYQPIEPDAEGRILSESTGLWFQISPDRTRVLIYEHPSGLRLLTPTERADRAESERARFQEELERLRGKR
jgi:hypothetical protein